VANNQQLPNHSGQKILHIPIIPNSDHLKQKTSLDDGLVGNIFTGNPMGFTMFHMGLSSPEKPPQQRLATAINCCVAQM
jgi:hypothetical protein